MGRLLLQLLRNTVDLAIAALRATPCLFGHHDPRIPLGGGPAYCARCGAGRLARD